MEVLKMNGYNDKLEVLQRFYRLISQQQGCPNEYAAVVDKRFWSLFGLRKD